MIPDSLGFRPKMALKRAIQIVECKIDGGTKEEVLAAWAMLLNNGMIWKMGKPIASTAERLIAGGLIWKQKYVDNRDQ